MVRHINRRVDTEKSQSPILYLNRLFCASVVRLCSRVKIVVEMSCHVSVGGTLNLRHSLPDVVFNDLHPGNPCNYMDYYSFTDPEGMEG